MPNEPDEGREEDSGPEVWQPSKPPPPMPVFPKIPENLKRAAEGSQQKSSGLSGIARGWAMALDFVGTVIASWLLGFLIDRWQKTQPWGSLIGLCFGFGYAIYRILRQTQQEERESRK